MKTDQNKVNMAVQAGGSKFQCSLSLRMLRNIHVRRSIPLRAQIVMKRIPHTLPTLKWQFLRNGILTVAETLQKDYLLNKDSLHERGFEMGNNRNFNFFF